MHLHNRINLKLSHIYCYLTPQQYVCVHTWICCAEYTLVINQHVTQPNTLSLRDIFSANHQNTIAKQYALITCTITESVGSPCGICGHIDFGVKLYTKQRLQDFCYNFIFNQISHSNSSFMLHHNE